ncbi:uracil-xanthine permease family protein [Streptacidiphilus jiangxiensis]|uniref:Xanthine/uracil permease n=1 Tax=Streptacidiphilus jiangxiensis TaxID=235985 RepID=A0A1H7QZQ9_STRJI|nr:solute carrier family 23 protein [Streptacidiphilus jiangxiensis]SEL53154.1 Xanthine/uracil permease [Streptacidiphilus jiangxiensis]
MAGRPPVTTPTPPPTPAVDARPPLRRLVPLAVQHVVAMAATPVSTVFLAATTLRLTPGQTSSLLGAVLLLSGAGSVLQSLGLWGFGARLPFVMLPGGAATALFLQVARDHGPAVASGSVLLAAAVLLAVTPLYGKVVRLFPPLVTGVTVLLVGISMVRISAQLLTGPGGQAGPRALAAAGLTVVLTLAAHLLLRGAWRQSAVLVGLVGGAVVAVACGLASFAPTGGAGVSLPQPLPYGTPRFDLSAALPLLLFSLSSLAEATGQTALNSEVPDLGRDVPRVARADALVSLVGGVLGAPPMVTSSENIGVTTLTGVRSRYVTAAAGVLLIAAGVLSPLSRVVAALPTTVVAGSALVVYATITVLGVRLLGQQRLGARENAPDADALVVGLALTAGLLPVVAPGLYAGLPDAPRSVLGSGVVAGTVAAVLLTGLRRVWPVGRSVKVSGQG